MDGLDVLGKLRVAADAVPVVMISGHGTVTTAVEATKLGAFDFIEKPLATERILLAIRNALGYSRLRDENRTLARTIEVRHDMVGASPCSARCSSPSGGPRPPTRPCSSGRERRRKELVARMIHKNSLRARERFVQVNCAAIPDELIESELFGHEKGSFTGATTSRSASSSWPTGAPSSWTSGRHEPEDPGQGPPRPPGGRVERVAPRARSRWTSA